MLVSCARTATGQRCFGIIYQPLGTVCHPYYSYQVTVTEHFLAGIEDHNVTKHPEPLGRFYVILVPDINIQTYLLTFVM